MHSCIYVGNVGHRRKTPTEHGFRYGLFMLYLDLDELPSLIGRRVLSGARFAPLSFRREDHPVESSSSLADGVRELVRAQTGEAPAGPVRLLTGLRCFGYYFSPLNLYYCFDPAGEKVETVVAEVSNTPWRDTHHYVLCDANRTGEPNELRFSHPKGFHVSPFMGMDVHYDWNLGEPGSRLDVQIANRRDSDTIFEASLALVQRELSRTQLMKLLLRYPWMTGRVLAAIYYQAFRLWRKKCPFHAHPKHRKSATALS